MIFKEEEKFNIEQWGELYDAINQVFLRKFLDLNYPVGEAKEIAKTLTAMDLLCTMLAKRIKVLLAKEEKEESRDI